MQTIPVFEQNRGRFPKKPRLAIAALIISHGAALLAGFIAPYNFEAQNRLFPFAPPNHVHFIDVRHKFHARPFVYRWMPRPGGFAQYREDQTIAFPIHLFVPGAPYRVLGLIDSRRHLFGTEGQAQLFLLGTDSYGRDQFSRLLYGSRISLFAGLLGAAVSISLGLALGGLAGYYGRWMDDAIMRTAEVFLAMPWLYLLLSVRAFLPLHIDPTHVFLLLIAVLGAIGWARPARLVRGVVLSAKHREYVLAAKGFGASDCYLLRTHVLPHAWGVALTQAALYIPQYIFAEVVLSFFGLGVSQPVPSWGNMLADLQQYFVLQSCWWMFAPAAALVLLLLSYQRLFSCYAFKPRESDFLRTGRRTD